MCWLPHSRGTIVRCTQHPADLWRNAHQPYLRIMDLEQVAALAQLRGILTVVDSTFATGQSAALGAGDRSGGAQCCKYLGGHNDLLAGVVAGNHR